MSLRVIESDRLISFLESDIIRSLFSAIAVRVITGVIKDPRLVTHYITFKNERRIEG